MAMADMRWLPTAVAVMLEADTQAATATMDGPMAAMQVMVATAATTADALPMDTHTVDALATVATMVGFPFSAV